MHAGKGGLQQTLPAERVNARTDVGSPSSGCGDEMQTWRSEAPTEPLRTGPRLTHLIGLINMYALGSLGPCEACQIDVGCLVFWDSGGGESALLSSILIMKM